jgi:hypothetical protein
MRIRLLVTGVVALLALAAMPTPAFAATTGDTTTTFTILAGSLSITVPATASVGSGSPGATISAQLGAVQISDGRAALVATWTATVTSSDFTTGGATDAETIGKANVSYWSGVATSTTGVGVFTPGQVNAGAAQTMGSSRTAYTLTAGVGSNSATWNPTLIVSPPASAVAGVYSGTVTHSVA